MRTAYEKEFVGTRTYVVATQRQTLNPRGGVYAIQNADRPRSVGRGGGSGNQVTKRSGGGRQPQPNTATSGSEAELQGRRRITAVATVGR